MKKHVKLLLMLLVVAVMALTACVDLSTLPSSSSDSDTPSTESELTLSAFSLSLYPEETATLIATLTEDGEEVEEFEVVWASSDSSVATVEDGVVTAVAEGNAIITATVGELTANCGVVVSAPVILTLSDLSLDLFEEETAVLTVSASDGYEYEYVWTSSAPEIATVEDGVVTAVAEGSAIITVSNGRSSATCEITVYEKIITMYLSQSSATLNVGADIQLAVTMSDGSTPEITWTSSAPEIASVEDGKVTALVSGSATITASAGEYSAVCQVTVIDNYELIFSEIVLESHAFVGHSIELEIIARKNGIDQDVSEVVLSGEGFTAAGNVITLTQSGTISITASYHGEEITRTISSYQEIATEEDFLNIANNLSGHYMLTADLDFGGAKIKSFSSYNGHQSDPSIAFTGIFDGQGHSISNFEATYNQTWVASDRDRGIFGYLAGGAIIRNVAFLNVISADRASIVASFVEGNAGCLIENIYVEASFGGGWGVNVNATNPGGYVVQKLNAGNTMRNCVLVLTIPAGSFAEVEKVCGNAGKSTMFGAMVGVNSGVMENCFALYKAEEGQATTLIYSGGGTTTNCGIYEDRIALWADADLSVLDTSIWNVTENSIPHIGNLAKEVVLAETTVEVNAGSSHQIQVEGSLAHLAFSVAQAGVSVDAQGLVTVGSEVAVGTVFTVTVANIYQLTKSASVTFTVLDKVEASADVAEITVSDIVAGTASSELELGILVKVNGVAVTDYTVESTNTAVVKVEDGKAVIVANGSASINVVYGGSVVLSIPVNANNVYTPIYTVEDFENIYNNLKGYYRLMNDLDFEGAEFSAFSGWASAFDAATRKYPSFTGIFDGNGYMIKNIIPKHDAARHSVTSSDASIFGIVGAGGVIKNLAVSAHVKYRGGVIASLVDNGGKIENCFVECVVDPSLADYTNTKTFGGIVFRTQKNAILENNIAIIKLLKNANGETANTAWMSGVAHVAYGISSNNFAIVISGEALKAITTTNATTVATNNAVYTSMADFYANADLASFNSLIWKLDSTKYPHIGNLSAAVSASESELEITVGNSSPLAFSSELFMLIESDTEGVTYENGIVSVASSVAPGTVATITAYCAYDRSKYVSVTVTVSEDVVEASAEVESISLPKYVAGTTYSVNLGVTVTLNGAAVENYVIESSNANVVTVENGVANVIGGGDAHITVVYNGSTLLTIPVSAVAYKGIYTIADFEAIFNAQSDKYLLMNDLDFEGATFNAFGSWKYGHDNTSYAFKGIFDGNGYAIKNVVIGVDNPTRCSSNRRINLWYSIWRGKKPSVLNATVTNRGGVIASGIGSTGVVENCLVECTVVSLTAVASQQDFGAIAFRAQAGSAVKNCISIVNVAEGVNTTYLGAIVGMNLSKIVENCQAIVVSGHELKVYTSEHGTVKPAAPVNTAVYTSLSAFYEGVNIELYDSSIWNLTEGYYPYMGTLPAITVDHAALEIPVGMRANLKVTAPALYSVSSSVEGITYENGMVVVADSVPANTEALITFTCLHTGNTTIVTVTVTSLVIEASAEVESISLPKYIIGTTHPVNLGLSVTLNGVATENYVVETSNANVVTVENGVANVIGGGEATITVLYNGSTLLTIPVSAVAYKAIYTIADFEAIFNAQSDKYLLMNDLDFKGATFNAFGSWAYGHDNQTYSFKGIFDGNGYAIKNVVIGVDNRHATVQTDASIFGTVFGVVRNLSVVNATVTNRGGVIASGIGNGGLIENCLVECNVVSLTAVKSGNDFGAIAFRAQATSAVKNCISIINVAAGVNTTYLGAIVGMNLSKTVQNCQAIVVSGNSLKVYTTEHGTVKPAAPVNTAVYTSLSAFYEGANLSLYTSEFWSFNEGEYPHMRTLSATISASESELEIPAGSNAKVSFISDNTYVVTSDTEGITYSNGIISVAAGVAPGTVATITAYCPYDKAAKATVIVTVSNVVIEASAEVERISNDKFVLGTSSTYNLGANLTINGVESSDYTLETSNAQVVTVENGVATLVGGGSANITLVYNGSALLTIPVSVVAYTPVRTVSDFEAIYSNQAGKYMLMNDIDFKGAEFNAFSGWASAFESPTKSAFTGIFDGNGYALNNITPKHDKARHPSDYSTDASIFGIIGAGGVIRNLKVSAYVKYRGAVIASVINGGLVENCYVECTLATTLEAITAANNFGGVVFRTQANGTMKNCICVMKLEQTAEGATVSTTMVGGVHGLRVGTVNNCFAIVTSGETLLPIAVTHASAKVGGDVNNASFTSYDAFFAAAETGADYSSYSTAVWAINAEAGTISLIQGCSYSAQ